MSGTDEMRLGTFSLVRREAYRSSCFGRPFQPDQVTFKAAAADELAIRHLLERIAVCADQPVMDRQCVHWHAKTIGRQFQEHLSRLGGGLTDLWATGVDRLTPNGGALVHGHGCIALHD